MPNALITTISQSPDIINKWRLHRHQHLQALINPLTQMYGLRGPDQMTCVAEWLDTTWVFKLGFFQPPLARDQDAYYLHSYPICDPSNPKDLAYRPREVQSLVESRTDLIPSGNSLTYSMKMLNQNNQWNELNLYQLYRHVRRKTDMSPLHNIYEVILYVLYHQQLLNIFPSVRNSCDGFTRIAIPLLAPGGQNTSEEIVRFHPYISSWAYTASPCASEPIASPTDRSHHTDTIFPLI